MMNAETQTAIARIKQSLSNLKRIAQTVDPEDARVLHLEADYIADQLAAIEADAEAECEECAELIAA